MSASWNILMALLTGLMDTAWATTGEVDHRWEYQTDGETAWLSTPCGMRMDKSNSRSLKHGTRPCKRCLERKGMGIWQQRWGQQPEATA